MEKLIKRITNIAIIIVAGIAVVTGLVVGFTKSQTNLDISMYLTYILLFIGIVLIAAFALIQVASSKKQLISALIMLVIAAAVFLVCYVIAPSELSDVAKRVDVSESVYRWIGAALNFAYIVFGILIVAFLGSFVYMKIKNS